MRLSIIIPALDEGEGIVTALDALAELRALGVEVIVVDGGSRDATVQRARLRADSVISAPRGRAVQMNTGAEKARAWGRFDVEIAGTHRLLPIIAFFMNLRSRVTGIATGDQAIFMRRDAFVAAGGFPPIALMEDIALCKRLKRIGSPLCLRERVVTSGRRWEHNGVLSTIGLMWGLRLAYFLGADPGKLARRYGYE